MINLGDDRLRRIIAVSYTHLDVYKRQAQRAAATCNQHDDTRILDTVVHDVDDFLLSQIGRASCRERV